jgi:hypothetical protein
MFFKKCLDNDYLIVIFVTDNSNLILFNTIIPHSDQTFPKNI